MRAALLASASSIAIARAMALFPPLVPLGDYGDIYLGNQMTVTWTAQGWR